MQVPVVLTAAEVETFFRHIGIPQYRAVLMLCYSPGLRISEPVSLTIGDINSQRMLIRIQHGKGGKDRCTVLSTPMLAVLRAYWKLHRSTWPPKAATFTGGLASSKRASASNRFTAELQRTPPARPFHPPFFRDPEMAHSHRIFHRRRHTKQTR